MALPALCLKTDLIVVVFLADAASDAMADYHTVTDGIVLVVVIVFWAYALDRLAFHFPRFAKLVKPPPLLLTKDGRVDHRNLRRESITEEDLLTQLRTHGFDDVDQVRRAYMEPDGRASVLPFGDGKGEGGERRPDVVRQTHCRRPRLL